VGNRAGSTPAPGTLKVRKNIVNQYIMGFFYGHKASLDIFYTFVV
jgi:hypothetical protein